MNYIVDSNVHHGTPSRSTIIDSNGILVLTHINIHNSTIQVIYIILLFYFYYSASSPFLGRFIPNFGYAPPQKLEINNNFRQMMYLISVVFMLFLSHHSLGLKISSLFEYLDNHIHRLCVVVDIDYRTIVFIFAPFFSLSTL